MWPTSDKIKHNNITSENVQNKEGVTGLQMLAYAKHINITEVVQRMLPTRMYFNAVSVKEVGT